MNTWEQAYGTPDQPQSWESDLAFLQEADDYERRVRREAEVQELRELAEWLAEEAYSRHGL